MKLEELKDVLQLNKLSKSWIEDYTNNNLGEHSPKLKEQLKEMKLIRAKTDKVLEKHTGDFGKDAADWKSLFDEIVNLAKSSPLFASCFGAKSNLEQSNQAISKETALLAIQIKKMTAAWFGRFEDVQDNAAKNLLHTIYEQALKAMAAPKTATGLDTITLEFFGSQNKRCRKMRKTLEFVAKEYQGLAEVVLNAVEEEDNAMAKIGVKNLPAIIFKRGGKKIAIHEGALSISALEQKVGVLVEGGNITDSSSMPSVKDMKAVNKKELYSLGEFLLFYFEASWCGICKKTTPVVEQYAHAYSNVKFEAIEVDGSHSLHESFDVKEVPALVFVRDGKVVGKHTGYINPSSLQKLMDEFAKAKKHKLGVTTSGETTVIKKEEK